ncbi:MAG: hypothetical protein A2014_03160 [Spirochaetes bacterium GWF1_49_6]|nr:MAG: hypothetical protein A2014_03160 [Spirochaetes bacterium GWF1_49_6]
MKKSNVLVAVLIISAMIFVSCGSEGSNFIKNTIGEYVTAMELQYMIEHKEPYKLIDLRLADAYQNGHIPTAKNMPYITPANLMYMVNEPYLMILYSNEDAIQKNIYMSLRKAGATNIVMLSGGIYSWSYGFVTD